MPMLKVLLLGFGFITIYFLFIWFKGVQKEKKEGVKISFPTAKMIGVGSLTNFFDTLGIGSYATTTALFRFFKLVDDRVIPGTLNIGHTLPTLAQAFIYTTFIKVDMLTLFTMILSSVFGAWMGAGVVAKWPKRKIQIGMGSALFVAASLMLFKQLNLIPGGAEEIGALGVRGMKLGIGLGVNFLLGALMTIGIGMYAPCMILISFLGMNIKASFPIMMGSCAFLMPVASGPFIREKSYNLKAALGLAFGGIPAVLAAAFLVRELPISTIRWLVIPIVIYTAISMLVASRKEK